MSNANNASVLNAVLGSLVSSYSVTEETPVVQVRKASKPRANLVKVQRAPSTRGVKVVKSSGVAPTLPKAGTLDAVAFLAALKVAGKICKENLHGVKVTLTDSNKERTDQVFAIAGFVGYSLSEPHGVQLDKARQKAHFIIRPVKTDSPVAATVKGFVAGMPNGSEREINNLVGRIRMATDTMLDLEKEAEACPEGSTERATKLALATVESERIAHMRRDLETIGG